MDSGMRGMWDERYAAKGHLWGAEPNVFLVEIAGDVAPGTALDLGCGQGRNAIWLASRGHTVTGLDFSAVAIDQAREIAAESGIDVSFEAVDLSAWEPGGEVWDLVLLTYVHMIEERRRTVHAAAANAVAPGGRIVIIAHHLDNLEHGVGGPPIPELLFTEEQLAGDFADFQIERNERVIRPTENGDDIDIVFVARKL